MSTILTPEIPAPLDWTDAEIKYWNDSVRLVRFVLLLLALMAVAFCIMVSTANAATHRDGTVVYSTGELRDAISTGPRCLHIDNWTNKAYIGHGGVSGQGGDWEYTDQGDVHLTWSEVTPVWVAARTETAFAVISASRGPGHIHGWTCARYFPAQVPA